jgi:hypothetical protein
MPHEVPTSPASPSAIADASRSCSCNTMTTRTAATSGSERDQRPEGTPARRCERRTGPSTNPLPRPRRDRSPDTVQRLCRLQRCPTGICRAGQTRRRGEFLSRQAGRYHRRPQPRSVSRTPDASGPAGSPARIRPRTRRGRRHVPCGVPMAGPPVQPAVGRRAPAAGPRPHRHPGPAARSPRPRPRPPHVRSATPPGAAHRARSGSPCRVPERGHGA